ncbi:MAG: glycosyltransferase family 4 protein [Actinomycetota bacterium]
MAARSAGTASRALFVTHSYYLRDTRPRRLATALADAGWDVDVLCARDDGEPRREHVGPIHIRRLPARRRRGSKLRYAFEYASFGAMAWAAMATMYPRRRYDLVWVLSIPNILVRSAAVPKLAHTRVVLDVRDPMPEFFMSKYGLPADDRFVRALLLEERMACRYATHVVTVHDAMKTLLLRTGVDPDKIGVVMNAPDPRVFGDTGPAHARDPDDRTVLYTGTVAGRFGIDLLVRAVAALQDEIPRLRLRVVGDGDVVPGLRNLARELGIADRVSFDGPVPLDRIPGIVQSSWVGAQAHPNDPFMRYSLSTKALEWCALGLPVICSRTDALDRALRDDEVTFIRPGDLDDLVGALRRAHGDPKGLRAKADHARESVRRFDWAREKNKLLAIAAG